MEQISDLIIRQEHSTDFDQIDKVIRAAFLARDIGHNGEADLVKRLRKSKSYIPELALVAELNGTVVGHILLTRIQITRDDLRIPSLALAPISVHPDYQGKGIGGQLIETAHLLSSVLNERHIILVGHEDYYPSFGYVSCTKYGIQFPFPVPEKNGMIYFVKVKKENDLSGVVEYDPAFME